MCSSWTVKHGEIFTQLYSPPLCTLSLCQQSNLWLQDLFCHLSPIALKSLFYNFYFRIFEVTQASTAMHKLLHLVGKKINKQKLINLCQSNLSLYMLSARKPTESLLWLIFMQAQWAKLAGFQSSKAQTGICLMTFSFPWLWSSELFLFSANPSLRVYIKQLCDSKNNVRLQQYTWARGSLWCLIGSRAEIQLQILP